MLAVDPHTPPSPHPLSGTLSALFPAIDLPDLRGPSYTTGEITLHETSHYTRYHTTGYAIRAPETITLMVPASATTLQRTVQAPSLTITASAGALSVTGVLRASCTASMLRSPDAVDVLLTLDGDFFKPEVGTDNVVTRSLLSGINPLAAPLAGVGFGWEAAVRPILTYRDVIRVNDSAIRVRVPQVAHLTHPRIR